MSHLVPVPLDKVHWEPFKIWKSDTQEATKNLIMSSTLSTVEDWPSKHRLFPSFHSTHNTARNGVFHIMLPLGPTTHLRSSKRVHIAFGKTPGNSQTSWPPSSIGDEKVCSWEISDQRIRFPPNTWGNHLLRSYYASSGCPLWLTRITNHSKAGTLGGPSIFHTLAAGEEHGKGFCMAKEKEATENWPSGDLAQILWSSLSSGINKPFRNLQ